MMFGAIPRELTHSRSALSSLFRGLRDDVWFLLPLNSHLPQIGRILRPYVVRS